MGRFTIVTAGAWMAEFAAAVHGNATLLTELDSAIGDADHGSNLDRGMTAVSAIDPAAFADAAAYLKKVGMTLVGTVGGASGPLYGTFAVRLAGALPHGPARSAPAEPGPDSPGSGESGPVVCGPAEFAAALRAGVAGIRERGKAQVGDKTMLDALEPAAAAYEQSVNAGADLAGALAAAAAAAASGRDATAPLVARKGRASYLGERSAGHIDPGAASATLLIEAAARAAGGR